MESWLVTVDDTITDAEAFKHLVAAGATLDAEIEVIPFDKKERAITVFATAPVASNLISFKWVCGVFPNSEMRAY